MAADPSAHPLVRLAAERGWAVFPLHHVTSSGRCSCGRRDCPNPGKHPRTRHGVKEATKDPVQLEAWARRWPSCNIGVATGTPSQLLVIDCDGAGAWRWLRKECMAHGDRLDGLVQITPRVGGGRHVFVRLPAEGGPYLNSASKLAPKVDTRGEGGYVVVAPSNHVNGTYRWVDADAVVPPCPAWLAELVGSPPAPAAPATRPHRGRSEPAGGAGRGYADTALAAEVRRVRDAPSGTRNHTLNEAAYNLGQLVAGGELDEGVVGDELLDAALAAGLSAKEASATIASGLRAGGHSPRQRPPRDEPPPPTGADAPAAGDDEPPGRPTIKVNNRFLELLADEMQQALVAWNLAEARLFERGGLLVRVLRDETGRPFISRHSVPTLRLDCAYAAAFVTVRSTDDGYRHTPTFPPRDATAALLERGNGPWPQLKSVTTVPVLRPDGTFHSEPGYDAATGYYHWPRGHTVAPIPERPSRQERDYAWAVISDLLADFPFASDADRANAWAFLLTPLVRPILEAVPPMALIDAPTPATGKGLLVKLVSVVSFGATQAMTPLPDKDEEFAKLLTAYLLAGQPMVILDNVERTIRSTTLAAALTSPDYQGRILGISSAPPIPNSAIYVATGNNLSVGGDMARRCYRIRLDARMARPERRSGFRHEGLVSYARAERHRIVHALCVLVRAWWVDGQPEGSYERLGEATEWARIIGGILTHVGIEGFLANVDEMRALTDVDDAEWAAFLTRWYGELGNDEVTVAEITRTLNGSTDFRDAIPSRIVGAWDTKTWSVTLGANLRTRTERYHGDPPAQLHQHGQNRMGQALWSVTMPSD